MTKNLMFTEMRDPKTAQRLFKDTDSHRIYQEVRGGFSWPGVVPAFVCAVAQEYRTGTLYIVDEGFEDTVIELARRLEASQILYQVSPAWIVPTEGDDQIYVDMLWDTTKNFNTQIIVSHPRLSNNFHIALQVIRKLFKLNNLRIPKGGILEKKLKEVNHIDARQPSLEAAFPEIMVLSRVCYEFPSPEEYLQRNRPKDKWGWDDEPSTRPKSWMAA